MAALRLLDEPEPAGLPANAAHRRPQHLSLWWKHTGERRSATLQRDLTLFAPPGVDVQHAGHRIQFEHDLVAGVPQSGSETADDASGDSLAIHASIGPFVRDITHFMKVCVGERIAGDAEVEAFPLRRSLQYP